VFSDIILLTESGLSQTGLSTGRGCGHRIMATQFFFSITYVGGWPNLTMPHLYDKKLREQFLFSDKFVNFPITGFQGVSHSYTLLPPPPVMDLNRISYFQPKYNESKLFI
jgi:hypothetical protein